MEARAGLPQGMLAADVRHPATWLVLGDKLGDNAQVEIVANALGWPCERKRLVFREPYVMGKPPFRASLYHIDRARSDALTPPWPDLVLTVGRRPSMAALWIRKQSRGRTKVAIVGRPKRRIGEFGLVIATPQYLLPERPNVLRLDLPLMRADEAKVSAAAESWRDRFAALPRPLTAVLVGGPTKPFVFDRTVVRDLIDRTRRSVGHPEGTLYVTTSRRTPSDVVDALAAALPPSAKLYRWTPGGSDNPYLALLGLADRFVVTGDSISMMVEVARLGKPLAIFPLPVRSGRWTGLRQWMESRLFPPTDNNGRPDPMRWLGDALNKLNLVGYSRDLLALHRSLIRRGLAVRLGEPFPPPGAVAPDDLPHVVERIQALTASSAGDHHGLRNGAPGAR